MRRSEKSSSDRVAGLLVAYFFVVVFIRDPFIAPVRFECKGRIYLSGPEA
jgi:hypothetical protein